MPEALMPETPTSDTPAAPTCGMLGGVNLPDEHPVPDLAAPEGAALQGAAPETRRLTREQRRAQKQASQPRPTKRQTGMRPGVRPALREARLEAVRQGLTAAFALGQAPRTRDVAQRAGLTSAEADDALHRLVARGEIEAQGAAEDPGRAQNSGPRWRPGPAWITPEGTGAARESDQAA